MFVNSVNASGTTTAQRWTTETRLTPMLNMRMPTNITLPGVKQPISVTKFGLQSNDAQIDRNTLLHFGDVVVAPHLFFFYGAQEKNEEIWALDPEKVLVFGSAVSGGPSDVEDGESPAYLLVKLADAQAEQPLCGASNRVQYTTEAAKRQFRNTWALMAKTQEDQQVAFVDMTVILKAFKKGEELQKRNAAIGESSCLWLACVWM